MNNLACLILAAGDSSRMGEPKALLKYRGAAFLSHVYAAAKNSASPIVLVTGAHTAAIEKQLPAPGIAIAVNEHPEGGMISSVRVGLRALPENITGVFIALVDQPFVPADVFAALALEHAKAPEHIIIARYMAKKRGHPIILPKAVLPLCFEGPDNLGLHWVTHHPTVKVRDIDFETDAVIRDIDTPQDYLKLVQEKP